MRQRKRRLGGPPHFADARCRGRSSVIRPDGEAARPFMRQRKRRLGGPETAGLRPAE